VYSKGNRVANIWRVPIREDREATWADAEQLTFDQANIGSLDLSADRQQLILNSDRGGNGDIWVMPVHGGAMRQLTTDRAPDANARLSPDGQQIAFQSYRSGNWDIWAMPVEGGAAVQLTDHSRSDMSPSWSPDGRQIVFYSARTDNVAIFTVPASGGGEARRITIEASQDYSPEWSPDAKWIAFVSFRGDRVNRLWRVPATGGAGEQLTAGPGNLLRWSGDGKRIYFLRGQSSDNDVWTLTVEGRTERRLTRFSQKGGRLGGALASDDRHLYFTWRNNLGDIWVMDVVGDIEK
jgi:TolB protein